MVLTSFHSEIDAASNPPDIFAPLTLDGYKTFFGGESGASPWPSLINSAWASIGSTILVILLAIPAAYALSVKPVRKWTDVMFFFLTTKMLPAVAGLMPIYLIAAGIGLLDNIWFMVIIYTAMNLPIAIWMLRSFLADVPPGAVRGRVHRRRQPGADPAPDHRADHLPRHRRHRPDLLHLRLERTAVRQGPHRRRRADRTRLPHRVRHLPGPVPRPALCGHHHRLPAGARSPGSPPRTSSSRACPWEPSNEPDRHRSPAEHRDPAALPAAVPGPSYDRSQVTTGIVHFGVGGFHRAHQAMYLDRLMNQGKALDWGICGVGRDVVRRPDETGDGRTGLPVHAGAQGSDGTWEPRVIGSIVEYLFAPDDPDAVIEKMADPATRIVSLTVTEGGYNFHQVTGEFDAENPAVAADLEPGAVPGTTFGLITEALVRRRDRGLPPFTIMSCDNIQGNGHVAQKVFTTFARLRGNAWGDGGLGDWVQTNVLFPNSMVDRITPATTDQDRADIADRFGIADGWPVVCEPFTQWVLEDHFVTDRPPFEDVGVQLVQDVEPYELMKLRLLNASHQGLCYFGYLAGYRLVHDVAQDPLFARFLLAYMDREATPTLSPVPGIDLDEYKHQLIERFSNAGVRDTVPGCARKAPTGSRSGCSPWSGKTSPPDRDVTLSAAIVASWARYAEAVDEQGQPIEVVDRLKDTADRRRAAATRQTRSPSLPTLSCSATWPMTTGSPPHTYSL